MEYLMLKFDTFCLQNVFFLEYEKGICTWQLLQDVLGSAELQ